MATKKPSGKIKFALFDFDADGLLAYVLACFANATKPTFLAGIQQAKAVFEPNCQAFEKQYRKLLDNGTAVSFDTAGGPFDHHPSTQFPGQCAFKLVAVASGFYDEDPAIRKMADNAAKWDTKGGSDRDKLWDAVTAICKGFLRECDRYPTEQEIGRAVQFAWLSFETWYGREQAFCGSLKELINAGVILSNDGSCKACIVASNDLYVRDVAQSEGYAICVHVVESKGQIWVRGNRKLKREKTKDAVDTTPMVEDIARIMRAEIAIRNGCHYTNPEILISDGAAEGSVELYFAQTNEEIYVGGNRRKITGILPKWDDQTRDQVLRNAVLLAINRSAFPSCCPGAQGKHGCLQQQCPLHRSMLPRCLRQGLNV